MKGLFCPVVIVDIMLECSVEVRLAEKFVALRA